MTEDEMDEIQMRVSYIHSLMFYIEQEYDNIPDRVTPDMAIFFNQCFDQRKCLPNASGEFADIFLKATA
jgi:hypothetical protein